MLSMDVLQFIKWCNKVRVAENLLLWRQKYKSVFRAMWGWSCSIFTMWMLPDVRILLRHQVCLTKDGEKNQRKNLSTLPVSHFLFTVRHNKWLVSIPPENNITPAVAFCPCLPCLPPPVFSFSLHLFFFWTCSHWQTLPTSSHIHTYTSHPSLPS